jgi:hypothetical protein
VPASCATLCTKLAELARGIDDQIVEPHPARVDIM